jgi:hypothetical protein
MEVLIEVTLPHGDRRIQASETSQKRKLRIMADGGGGGKNRGVTVEELKEMGMSSTDIEYIRDTASSLRQQISRSGTAASSYGPTFVVEAFEQRLALAIA